MANLGEFGAAQAEAEGEPTEPDTISWYGEEIRVRPAAELTVPLMVFAAKARDGVQTRIEELAITYDVLAGCIHQDDVAEFFDLAKQHSATEDDLWPIVRAIMTASTGRPTPPPTDSSAGRRRIGVSSSDESPTPREMQRDRELAEMVDLEYDSRLRFSMADLLAAPPLEDSLPG